MNKTRTLIDLPALQPSRVHEISGISATAFAFLMSRKGPILLCGRPDAFPAHPEAVARFCDPDALLHVQCPLETEVLWAAETALRSGSVSTVMVAVEKSPNLTKFRRLQLAALTGRSLGMLLVNRPAHSTAAETRWHCTSMRSSSWESFGLHASLYKNKKGLVGAWVLNVTGEKNTLHMVAEPCGEPIWPERIAG